MSATESTAPPTILVVGGGAGIGAHTTSYILSAPSSAKVIVFGLHISPEISALQTQNPDRLWILQGDASRPEDRVKAKEFVLSKLGKLDVLVVTVGIMGEISRLGDGLTELGLQRTFDVNVFAPVFTIQQFIPELRKTRGRVLILSSAVDRAVQYSGWLPYCASKAALSRSIELIAHEERDTGVHVLGVYPGLTRTSMIDDILEGKFEGIMYKEEMERFRRWNEPDMGTRGIEPPEWCAAALGKMALGEVRGGESGEVKYYYEFVPDGNVHSQS